MATHVSLPSNVDTTIQIEPDYQQDYSEPSQEVVHPEELEVEATQSEDQANEEQEEIVEEEVYEEEEEENIVEKVRINFSLN